MAYVNTNNLTIRSPGIREPYLDFLRRKILPEIRGEKVLGIVNMGDKFDICANCYAYGDNDIHQRCANHVDEIPSVFKKVSFVEFSETSSYLHPSLLKS